MKNPVQFVFGRGVVVKIVLGISVLGSSTGCGKIWSRTPAQLSTTQKSAGAGAVVGAGLGALIGSTSGDAGAGLAIGAAAGTAAGFAVGHQLEKQENAQVAQREAVTRQSEQIDQQGRELQELRRGYGADAGSNTSFEPEIRRPGLGTSSYPSSSQTAAQSGARASLNSGYSIDTFNKPSRQGAVGSPGTSYGAPAQFNERSRERADLRSEVRARLHPGATAGVAPELPSYSPPSSTQPYDQGSVSGFAPSVALPSAPIGQGGLGAAAIPSSDGGLPPATVVRQEAAVEKETAEETTADALSTTESAEEVGTADEEVAAAVESAPVQTSKAPAEPVQPPPSAQLGSKDGNCSEAEAEAKRARSASSEADKLFYYRRALRLCSKEPSYHIELGRVYAALGRKEDAQFEFNKALELDPENEVAQDELSLIMLDNPR